MSDGHLEQIHERELIERRRALLYQLALAAAIFIVLAAVAVAALSILAVE